ncbi:FecR family protein [Cellvibrio japonicus]|uniref:Sigma factor regulatory protein, FecR/PupR family n=1 Tax=Cellvibrio japonicus (strain Ueda107) TaxID=498211 RepID=B3PLQ9_CELJU|nr:FecR domain-containing protein [Cellvibrio japonicus]ACE84478.1 sigma factor regulatory protein, FecR/PupR family [Cellvibrio japonicus Ueda107]QEI13040.1 DUF4880 domain-containing protein [Cellvibrio japonicus]QEI16614.1 DUF4880 domain-containing protein [Cellvibrio japonicus]QEI20192.1 DUF4880 domain-containing protein [Cellvibrio japonicus]
MTDTQIAIDEQASHWFALMLEPPVSASQQQAFQQWYNSDPRHRQAYSALQSLWRDSAVALAVPAANDDTSIGVSGAGGRRLSQAWYRQRPWQALTGLAACLFLAVVLWPFSISADYRTGIGQQQVVLLPDGSRAHLNSDSALAVHYSDKERRLEVLSGDVWFDVAPNPQRPFRVMAAGGETVALGTAFAVSLQPRGADVVVTEHQVRVSLEGDSQNQRILNAGEGLSYRAGSFSAIGVADESLLLSWRNQQLVFLNQPLIEVMAILEHWHPGKLVLLGDSLAQHQVTLILDTRQPEQLLDKLVQGLNLKTFSVAGKLTFIYQ